MANLAAGEIGVNWGEKEYVFRPSFRAMASLGTPEELAAMLDSCQAANASGFAAALAALSACCEDDVGDLVGYYKDVKGRLRYVQKRLPWQDVYVLGLRCLINGMAGDLERAKRIKPGKDDAKPRPFDPAEFATAAMVHLGLSRQEAWDMTMVEFQRAAMVKNPDKVQDLPTSHEYRTAIDTVKRIRERAKEQSNG